MDLKGFLFPRTSTGRSSLLPTPPWHYSGDLLTVEYRADPSAVARLLPHGHRPPYDDEDPGAVAFIWADWQSCSDSFAEIDDPVRLQYKEAFVVVRCRWNDQLWSRCVYIWVDKDYAVARGTSRAIRRSSGRSTRPGRSRWVERARGSAPGGRFGATLAAYDRRLAQATLTLDGPAETNGFVNSLPMLHNRWLPRIECDGTDTVNELVTMRGIDVELGPVWHGEATLELFDSPVEELLDLAPREMLGGYWRSVGTTFAGGTTLT